ncbi:Nucleoprotein [Frankliniella fusca]|uniref:Nucleoprotein n=1 Tax=Frankliniella fusca TaxID=407009 RepID=A0AAE1I464_9NEOP|nr:Nucleoprotein [Frankliniella fusca]
MNTWTDTIEELYVVENGAAITSINEDNRCLNIEDLCAEGGNISAFEYSSVVEVHVGSSWEDHGNISDVDLHWPELFNQLAPDEDFESMSTYRKRQLVKNNPMIVDPFFLKRVEIFMEEVLTKKYKIKDYWFRIEYQHRGSPHMHGVLWMENAPDVTDMEHKSEKTCKKLLNISLFTPIWINHPVLSIHAKKKKLIDIHNLDGDLAEILNRVQRHTICSKQYCIRQSKKDKTMKCRFKFPQDYQEEAKLTFDEQQNVEFLPKRNDDPR